MGNRKPRWRISESLGWVGGVGEIRAPSVRPQGSPTGLLSLCSGYKRAFMGSHAGRKGRWDCRLSCLLYLAISVPLFSKDGSLLPQSVTKITRLKKWSNSSVVSHEDSVCASGDSRIAPSSHLWVHSSRRASCHPRVNIPCTKKITPFRN